MFNENTLKAILTGSACLFLLLAQIVSAEQKNEAQNPHYVELQTASKQTFKALVAGPQDAKQAILIIHGWFGLNREVEIWANEFAAAGYRVMAVDLYKNQVTADPAVAKKLMLGIKQSEADEKYLAAINALSATGRKVAVTGRSYGGNQAFYAARVSPEKVSAVIAYYPYGKLLTDKTALAPIRKTPILGHFARDDFFLTPPKFAEYSAAIKKAKLNMTINVYEARHGFDKTDGKNFNEAASTLAQQRTNQFLQQHLN